VASDIEYILLHIIPAIVAGLGAYFGVKYAIKDHASRLDYLWIRQDWIIRKVIEMITRHNANHPEDVIRIDDYPKVDPGAFKL
jgi:hypothetical protein